MLLNIYVLSKYMYSKIIACLSRLYNFTILKFYNFSVSVQTRYNLIFSFNYSILALEII